MATAVEAGTIRYWLEAKASVMSSWTAHELAKGVTQADKNRRCLCFHQALRMKGARNEPRPSLRLALSR